MKQILSFFLVLLLTGCTQPTADPGTTAADLSAITAYSGDTYVVLGDNVPDFSEAELTTTAYESYSPLDELGRCGVADANLCQALMPTEKRGDIGMIKPTGWHTVKYDWVDGKYLYNRCHLIGFQLAGENANERNLITGTRYFNVEGMLPFENMVADYIKETDHHVRYRVTPICDGDNLVVDGVRMEAQSVEDDEICYDVYVYNCQPGVTIDYATGESWASTETPAAGTADELAGQRVDYVLNINTKKFHRPDCASVQKMQQSNREDYTGSRAALIEQGYTPCGSCKP